MYSRGPKRKRSRLAHTDGAFSMTSLERAAVSLIEKSREQVAAYVKRQEDELDSIPMDQRLNTPRHYHNHFSYNGATAQLQALEDLVGISDSAQLCASLPQLRDAFSLFPENEHLRVFLGDLLVLQYTADVDQIRQDCAGKRVILHTSCHHRLSETKACLASFENHADDRYHHIVLLGDTHTRGEAEIGLSLSYDGQTLQVPTPDTYEHLHRKLFYAYMLLDLIAAPQMVIKVDDNLLLQDAATFNACANRVIGAKAAFAGRLVGTHLHKKQWHGWHVGKCADPSVNMRGYQYPLPREYAAGGAGYILGPQGLSACAYMYIAMQAFFDLAAVGLEDVYVGHAAVASNLTFLNLWPGEVQLALPGLTTKERQSL